MSTETLIALISAIAALLSALFAWQSRAIAKAALKLSEVDHEEKHANITLYLIDSGFWENDNQETIVSLACSLTNGANAPNTIVRLDLVIHAYDEEGNLSRVILSPSDDEAPARWDLHKLTVPVNLEPRSTLSGWINFKVPRLLSSKRIDRYEFTSVTSTGERTEVASYILRKLPNENS